MLRPMPCTNRPLTSNRPLGPNHWAALPLAGISKPPAGSPLLSWPSTIVIVVTVVAALNTAQPISRQRPVMMAGVRKA